MKPRRVFVVVMATLAAAVGANLAIGSFLRNYTTNLGYYLIARKWKLLDRSKGPVDWLILGDSSCNQGVRPDVIERLQGDTALNLCTTAQQLVVEGAWQLQEFIARHGAPNKGIVVVHVYDVWPTASNGRGGQWPRPPLHKGMALVPLPWGFWRELDPALQFGDSQLKSMAMLRYMPGYAQSTTLRKWLLGPRSSIRAIRERKIDEFGYMKVEQADPRRVKADTKQHRKYARKDRFSVSKLNRVGLDAIDELAAQHGLPVFLALGPIDRALVSAPSFNRLLLRRVRPKIETVCERSRATRCLFFDEPVVFSAELMTNSDHVVHEAAARYTERLFQAIDRKAPPSP
ncbi:MAG: hypothetical protein AAF715_12205 [Myxococcota bacterium]